MTARILEIIVTAALGTAAAIGLAYLLHPAAAILPVALMLVMIGSMVRDRY